MRSTPLSTNLLAERPVVEAGPEAGAPQGAGAPVGGVRAVAAILSPVAAALVALAVHLLLPNAQDPSAGWTARLPAWLHPYPIALEALLVALPLLASLEWLWGKVKPQAIRALAPLVERLRAAGRFLWERLPWWRPVVRLRRLLLGAVWDVCLALRPWDRRNAPLAAGGVLAFCAWDLLTLKLDWLTLPYFPGPDAVLAALVQDRHVLFDSACQSLLLLLTGYAVGVTAGVVSGVLIGWFTRVRYWGMPILRIFGPVPATALVPLVMTLSSNAFVSGAALIGYAVWFPVTMLTSSGVSNVRISYLDVARTLGAGRLYLISRVAFPAALPSVFLGMFMGLVVSFLTLIVAETVGVQAGLGYYLTWQQGYVEYAKVYAALLLMTAFFSTLMTLLFKVRDRVLTWQKGVIKW
jgi:NitT/TauT family transport system permease protein